MKLVSWSQVKVLASRLHAKPCVYVFQAVPAWTKWRKSDHVTGRRQLNLSLSSRAVRIYVVGMTTIFAANNAVSMNGNHFALKTVPVSFVRTGCLRCGLRKPRPTLWEINARPQRRRRQPRKLKRPWTIPWRYTLRKRWYNFLPSLPSPRDRPRRSGRKPKPRRLNPLNPSQWLPASRWWDGPALTGQTVASPGVQSASEDTGTTDVRIFRDISRHGVTAPGERASGPCQVPLAVPAPGGVPSPAVSPRRRTPVRRPLPLDIIIILQAIVNPFHQLHLGHLPTAGLRPVTREDKRVPTGRVRRTSPDGMSSCPPRVPSRLRRERSRWSLRRPGRFMLNRPQKFQSRHWWRTARQVPTRAGNGSDTGGGPAAGNGTATGNGTAAGDGSDTGDGPATGDRPVTVDDPASDDPADVSEVESELHFDEPDETNGPARLPTEARIPAVSPRRRTPVRRPLPLDIIIILQAIVNPFHQLHLGHLPTAGLRPVTREDKRVPTGRVRRTSPDGMSSCPPRVPSRLRRERSRWSLRRPGRFMLNRPQKFQSRHWWRTARQVPTRAGNGSDTGGGPAAGNGTATGNGTAAGDGSDTGDGPATGDRPVTVDDPASDDPADVSEVESELHFDEPDETNGPARLPTEARIGTPAATSPGDGPDVSRSTGTSSLLFPSIPRSINQETLVDFMSMWTLLQRRMDQLSVPVAPACPPDQSAAPAPRHDSTNRRSATLARTPERRPKSPERFLHTPQSTVSSFLRRAREPERKARTPVRQARTPVRQRSESRETRSRSPLSRSSSVESPARDESPLNFTSAMDLESKRDISDDEGDDDDSKKISAAQYKIFRQAVSTSKGSYKVNPAKTKRASRASLLDLGDTEVTNKISWLDQPSLQDTMASTARIAQGLKEDEEVVKTTLSETLNSDFPSFKFFTVKQIFPREPYRLKIHRDALYAPKPPGDHGFSNNKAPSSYHMSHRVCLDTEELARRSAIYASLADSMVASVIEELSPKDERTKLLWEKLAIIQEAQVSAISAGFAAASNLQLLRRDALLKNFNFQPQVLASVRTAPFEGDHAVGPEPKVLQNRVRAIRQADVMTGSSVTFLPKQQEPKTSKKVTLSKKTAQRPSVFDRLGSPTSTPQRTVTQEPPFRAGAGRARPRPFQGSKKSGKASSATSTRQSWRVPGGGSPGRLCPALAESTGQLPGHRHRRGRGGHCIPATTSAHPSKHQFPDQEQPTGSSASHRCLADEGSHRASHQREVPGILQSVVSGSQEDEIYDL